MFPLFQPTIANVPLDSVLSQSKHAKISTLYVTDLENSRIGALWAMRTTACAGDASPSEMKISGMRET
jgi:hypothetical protein